MKKTALVAAASLAALQLSACSWLGGLMAPDKMVKVDEVGRSQHCNATSERTTLEILPTAVDAMVWQRRNELDLSGNVTLPPGKYIVIEMGQRDRDGYGFVVSPQARIDGGTVELQSTFIVPDEDTPVTSQSVKPCVMLHLPNGSWDEAVLYDQTGERRAKSMKY